jgi:hypothetical protein
MATPVRLRGLSRERMRVGTNLSLNYANPATVDLADLDNDRIVVNRQGRYVSMPDIDFELSVPGGLATLSTASGLVIRAVRPLTVKSVVATVGVAPVGAALILDVHKIASGGAATAAGTTIFTTQARRPTIADGATVSTLSATAGVPEVTALAAGDMLRVEVDQVGSGTAGSALRVHIRCEPA